MHYRTPIIRVKKGREVLKFYVPREYELWKSQTPDYNRWEHFYYKGLGSSDDAEVYDDHLNPRVIHCLYDNMASATLRLAFDKKLSNHRKDWIGGWRNALDIEDVVRQPITSFIHHELILYSIDNVQRSIPRMIDGWKVSHRKLIYGAQKLFKIGPLEKSYKRMKVAQFTARVASETQYHHGERVLDDVLVGLVQDFTGSNNIRFFVPRGQYGTRYKGGKDASATRYTFTEPERILPYIIRKEDNPILEYLTDEGDQVEPVTYYPVIPLVLVNGAHGISTGWSTFVANYNPLDIIQWLRVRLQNLPDDQLPEVLPWYRGFKGTVKLVDRRKDKAGQVTVVHQPGIPSINGVAIPSTQIGNHEANQDISIREETIEEAAQDESQYAGM